MPNSIGQLQSKGKSVGTARMGKLYTFKYMATEDMTPYYDMYPTIIVIRRFTGGFRGINFNYIDHEKRKVLLKKLSGLFGKQSGQKVFNFKGFRPLLGQRAYRSALVCVRNYKFKNLRSPLVQVDDSIWDEVLNRCDEMFVRVNPITKSRSLMRSELVWRNSLKRIRGTD